MTKEEYDKAHDDLQKAHRKAIDALARKYVLELPDTRKVGDVVEDHYGRAKVEKVLVAMRLGGCPQAVYEGPQLKKDGSPYKNGEASACITAT
jgi:hypothetical protein